MIFTTKNHKVHTIIKGFVENKRIPHAIMIEGNNSSASLELAQYVATAAVCDNDNSPCGICSNCHLAKVGSHPDVSRITALEGKKFLSVAQIRELRADAFVKAHQAPHRVFIIEDAHRMNEQAQNALLKVLEEPPKNVIFILVVPSKTMLLDTIISRCVLLSLNDDTEKSSEYTALANDFIDLLLSGSEYQMLKLLSPLEKSRTDAETFFNELAICVANRIKDGSSHARVLDKLFDQTKYYLDLLTTNINLSLLTGLVVSQSKGLIDK